MTCLGRSLARINAAKHGESEAGGLAAAIVCLCDHVLIWWVQDHRQRRRLDPAGPLELHFVVEPLQKTAQLSKKNE